MEYFTPTEEDNFEIDWINAQKAMIDPTTGKEVTWDKLSMAVLGRKTSTLSLIAARKYNAPYATHCGTIRRYRLQQQGKAERAKGRILHPGFVDLPTSRHIMTLLEKASDGKVVLICSDSGFSKTHVANHFKKNGAANVFMMTMDEATGGLSGMLTKVLGTMTKSEPRGSRMSMNTQILQRLTGSKATLIFDEASTLTTESFEQIRHWQDASGCGVAFLGNRAVPASELRRPGFFRRTKIWWTICTCATTFRCHCWLLAGKAVVSVQCPKRYHASPREGLATCVDSKDCNHSCTS
jgi:hypothetical protein